MAKRENATAWAFLVVSDAQQADTLADQEAWARDAATANGWTITRTISGVSSGKLGPRKLTLGMIAELEALPEAHRPKRILMIRLERLGRGDGLEAMNVFLQIRKLGITVHTRLDGDVGCNRASELLMPVLRFFIGGMENEVRRDKLIALYERRREARKGDPTIALSSKAAYGLRYENGHLVPQEPEATTVRLAFELKTQGYGAHLIAKRLAVMAPPMVLKSGEQRPQRWTTDRVRKLLLNETYRGIAVEEEIWLLAQRPIRTPQRPTIRYEYSLAGSLTCECGYALCGNRGTGKKSSPFRYYRCANFAAHDGHMKHHRSDRLEEQFIAILDRLGIDDGLVETFAQSAWSRIDVASLEDSLERLESELSALEARRRAIFEAFELGALRHEDLQWRLGDLHSTEETLRAHIGDLQNEIQGAKAARQHTRDVRKLLASGSNGWRFAAVDDRRALAKAVANALGGLTVRLDGTLLIGEPPRNVRIARDVDVVLTPAWTA